MDIKIQNSGVTSYWSDGEYIILYDPEIWYSWEDTEDHKVHLCLHKNSPLKKLIEEGAKQQNPNEVEQE